MKDLLLACRIAPDKTGTFEAYLAALARRCQAEGVRCRLEFSGPPSAPLTRDFAAAGAAWRAHPEWASDDRRRSRRAFDKLYLAALSEGPCEVAALQFCEEFAVARAGWKARLRGVAPKAAVWIQHSQMRMPGPLGRRLSRLRLLAGVVAHIVALAESARAAIAARGWPARRVTTIANGVVLPAAPEAAARAALRAELCVAEDETLLLCVGALIPRKGHDVLLAALLPLLEARPEVHLALVGGGPERAALEALRAASSAAARVRLLGQRNDVPALLGAADAFVLASHAEGLTLAVLEAMAAGLPVVATAVGGHAEVVGPDVGWLAPPGDAGAFRAAVAKMLGDRSAARRRGAAGRAQVEARHSLDAQVAAQFALFQRLADGEGAPP